MNEAYPHMFNAADLGRSLREVSQEVLRTPHVDVLSRWFHSAKDADLFIWLDPQHNILKQQLSYYGQIVEWNVVEGLKTGTVVIDEARETQKGSEILRFDARPQMTTVAQAMALLEHVAGLKNEERAALRRNFADQRGATRVSPEEFNRRFGEYLVRPRKPVPQASFFTRLMTRVLDWFKS